MSGRDLRNFITQFRSNEQDSLILRMKEGTGRHQNYRSVNYDELQKKIARHREKGDGNLENVRRIKKHSYRSQHTSLLKQHRKVWTTEYANLAERVDAMNREISLFRSEMHPKTKECMEEFETRLQQDATNFEKVTLDPVIDARKEVKYKIDQGRLEDCEESIDMMNSIATQQQLLLDQMYTQQKQLEIDVNEYLCEYDEIAYKSAGFKLAIIGDDAIAREASTLHCPDEQLREASLNQFHVVNHKYSARLSDLDQEYEDALNQSDWTDEECFLFQHVYEQYGPQIKNRRNLIVDRMLRQFPHKSRHHILEYEKSAIEKIHYKRRKQSTLNDWKRCRYELLNKIKVIFAECRDVFDENQMIKKNITKQKQICDRLFNQVSNWRDEKFEAMKLEEEKILEKYKTNKKLLHESELKDKECRNQQKDKIAAYNAKLKARKEEEDLIRNLRLQELQEKLKMQAEQDAIRVKYREEKVQEKVELQKEKNKEKDLEEEESEKRKEMLRQMVRPVVEANPLRMHSDTAAWKNHLTTQNEDTQYQSIDKSLFHISTFSDNQISKDPRIKLEQRLREIGLEGNVMAREAMKQMKPIHPPRKNLTSNIFDHNQ